ncbi:MAG: S-layer homology domain-containing protein [Oscillospiraceae bacterium]|nr:S-layer homology domain-containing protein [Oscillospiraceae bacterium]
MNVRKRGLALLMCICMIFTLLPFSALADEAAPAPAKTIYVDAKNGDDLNNGSAMTQAYKTVAKAVSEAADGDTIQLGEGNYTLYGVKSDGHTKGKSLTFVGLGADETAWNIGAEVPDPSKYGTEYNGDYSFDGAKTVTFKNMTLRSGNVNYLGFIRADNTVVENCVINGKTFYWGYTSATFTNTTFKCPSEDYALWTYSSPTMTFNNCTFNSSGKVINVYTDAGAGKQDITVNFNGCTVINTGESLKPVLNINDSNMGNYKYILNISGANNVTGVDADSATCSRLFGFGGKAKSNSGRTTVNFGNTTVWNGGDFVDADAYHKNGVTVSDVSYNNGNADANDSLYTDGYKDNAFETKIEKLSDRTVTTRTCKYCGWKEESTVYNWNIPLSKTATKFDKDYKTDVTLSVPGVQQSLDSDVVFVLDKSTSTDLETASLDLLTQLKNQVKDTGAKVKVGVVIFNKVANVTAQLTDISTDEGFNKVKAGIESEFESGTNTHAGLLAGKALLDNDTSVSADRKYLIFVSDGVTYQFCKDDVCTKAYTRNFNGSLHADKVNQCGTLSEIDVQYPGTQGKTSVPKGSIEAWMADITYRIGITDNDSENYDYEYTGQAAPEAQQMSSLDCVSNVEKALYLTKQVYTAAQEKGYKCYSVLAKDTYKFGTDFMNMLAGGKTVSFDSIKNDILYAVGAGSYVVDKIGDDFTLDENTLRVKVGEDQYLDSIKLGADENGNWVQYFGDAATQLSENNYRFKVEYNAADKTLTWTFNENVSNFAPVQLTYTLKLTTPATNPGTYGQLDLDGDEFIDETNTPVEPLKALYTNESAVLNPIDSDDNKGLPVEFPKPSLAYTVEKPYIPPVDPGIRDKITVEITGNSDSVVYDGTEHSVKDYTVKISDSRYTEKDFTFSGKALASGINAGTYEMGLKADQFKNTNARFKNVEFIIKADGVLTITQRPLTITAGSAEGIAPVTCDKYTVEGLATGDKVDSVKITGIQSEPGESPNVASDAVIKNAKGEDVTANYKITYVDGVLKAIEVLNKEIHFNYVIGYTDGTIRPNNDISRAEVATIFFRLLTDEAREQYTTTAGNFTDVKAGMWCNRAIATLTNMGIIKGYTDGSFQPNKSITRAELATIIARFAKLDVNTKTFSDINGHWAQKNIELAAGNGWINGYEDGTFRPNNNITRAETFAMINRVLDRQTESVSDLLPTSEMNMWSDNLNENAWYYKDVQEATNYHKCDRVGDSVYEKWTEKVPDIDWASYQI